MKVSRAVLLTMGLLATACGREESVAVRPTERQVTATRWDTLSVRGVAADDSLIGDVGDVLTSEQYVYVFDYPDQELLAFRSDGVLAWSFGTRGRGPGEFQRVRDIRVVSGDSVALLDPDNGRVTIVTPEGQLGREFRLPGEIGRADQFLPLHGGGFIVWTFSPDLPFAELSAVGELISRHAFPWERVQAIHPMAAQGELVGEFGEDRWAWVFVFGDRWVGGARFDQAEVMGLYPDSVPWPQISTTVDGSTTSTGFTDAPSTSGLAGVAAQGILYVLAQTEARTPRFVDRYRADSGEYLDSWALPNRPSDIAVRGDTLWVSVSDPFPGFMAIRPRRE